MKILTTDYKSNVVRNMVFRKETYLIRDLDTLKLSRISKKDLNESKDIELLYGTGFMNFKLSNFSNDWLVIKCQKQNPKILSLLFQFKNSDSSDNMFILTCTSNTISLNSERLLKRSICNPYFFFLNDIEMVVPLSGKDFSYFHFNFNSFDIKVYFDGTIILTGTDFNIESRLITLQELLMQEGV